MVLLILDGWGVAPASEGNAITQAKTPNMDSYTNYPNGELIASGETVGLPANEAGNSEVGHLTIGAGRVIYQSLPRINIAIKDGSFFDNKAFLSALAHVVKNQSKLHLMGLVSSGTIHSSIEHLYALLEFCKRNKLTGLKLHLFTDGRDAPPNDAVKVISQIEERLIDLRIGSISSISGRFYGMDRDGRWERTKKAYDAIVSGVALQASSAVEAVDTAYQRGQTDEFIEPTILVKPSSTGNLGPVSQKIAVTVDDNDAVIFFNFRIDRPRQLSQALTLENFESQKTFTRNKRPRNLFFVTMTEYQKNLPVSAIAFPAQKVNSTLSEVLATEGLKQMHMTESEKERMVTFYFDGLRSARFKGEDVEIIASPRVTTYDKKPEMSVLKTLKRFKRFIRRNKYHFYLLNFANADMVAHSGNVAATIKAIEVVDKVVGEVVNAILERGGTVVITADHGNAEELLTYPTKSFFVTSQSGNVNTEHSNNLVPIYIIGKSLKGKKLGNSKGSLADVATTILPLMGLKPPPEMNGRDLFESKS